MSLNIRKIPVFVFPNSLKFYLASKTTHKQLLTLYNPYDFPVRFKVFCTAPKKYAVIDPEGSIAPRAVVDVVIRHLMPVTANCGVVDKFRISMMDQDTKQVLGKRIIEASLLEGTKDNMSLDGDFHSVTSVGRGSSIEDQRIMSTNRSLPQSQSTFVVVLTVIAALTCVGILFLPTQDLPQNSNIPTYLHFSVNVKIVVAFFLGAIGTIYLRFLML